MWRHLDVQADWRSCWTYGRVPNAIDISSGSLTCPSKHRHGTTLFIRWYRHTAPFSRLLRALGIRRTHSWLKRPPPRALKGGGGRNVNPKRWQNRMNPKTRWKNHAKTILINFKMRYFDALSSTNQPKSVLSYKICYMCHKRSMVHLQWHSPNSKIIIRDFSFHCFFRLFLSYKIIKILLAVG